MNKSRIFPDDPRLTAYALGELEAGELAEVEAALRADPAARSAVEEIRTAAAQLSAALAGETIEAAAAKTNEERMPARRRGTGLRRGRWLVFLAASGLAAACLAALLIHKSGQPPLQNSKPIGAFSRFGFSGLTSNAVTRNSGPVAQAAPHARAIASARLEAKMQSAPEPEAGAASISPTSAASLFLASYPARNLLFDPSKSLLDQPNASVPFARQTGTFGALAIGGVTSAAIGSTPQGRSIAPVLSGAVNLAARTAESAKSVAPGGDGGISPGLSDKTGAATGVAGFGRILGFAAEGSPRVFHYPPDNGFIVLAKPTPAENISVTATTITIDNGGRIFFNGKSVDREQLIALLKQIAQVNIDTPVLIKAHQSSQVKTLVFVMDACRQANLSKFSVESR